MNINKNFLKKIFNKYSLGENFIKLYMLDRFPSIDCSTIENIEDIYGDNKLARSYVLFALSSVVRGRSERDLVLKEIKYFYRLRNSFTDGVSNIPNDLNGKKISKPRFLDIGCAYGGFLVAFSESGYECKGIEINEKWAKFGKE